jgi:hypothetical protein
VEISILIYLSVLRDFRIGGGGGESYPIPAW